MGKNNQIKRVRVIGDIHGRSNWIDIVTPFNEDTLYVFVGDYTDPYHSLELITFDQMIEQIEKMFSFKREHPDNVIILVGNHDLQYINDYPETSRCEIQINKYSKICKLFEENKELLYGVAYAVGDKYLITHAGVTSHWFINYCDKEPDFSKLTVQKVADGVNKVWEKNKMAFTFRNNARHSDHYGISSTHGPLWVRPMTLLYNNVFGVDSGIIQIIGHTPYYGEDELSVSSFNTDRIGTIGSKRNSDGKSFEVVGNDEKHVDLIIVDCLRRETACVEIDTNTMGWKKIYIGDVKSNIKWN